MTLNLGNLLGLLAATALQLAAGPADARMPGEPLVLSTSERQPQFLIAVTGGTRYSFLVPRQWSVAQDEIATAFRLCAPGGQGCIEVRFASRSQANETILNWHASLRQGRPEARLRETSTCEVLSREASLADVSWTHADSLEMKGRFVRVSTAASVIDLSLVCPAEHFEAALPAFVQLIATLRASSADQPFPARTLTVE